MKVLQLCNKPPFPAADGGALAMSAVTDGLLDAGIEVKQISIATHKHPFREEKIPAAWKNTVQPEAIFTDTRVKAVPAFLNLFGTSSYNIDRFYSPAFETKLKNELQKKQYDIIHLESLYMTPYIACIRRFTDAPVLLRAHNAEHRLWNRLSENETNPLKKKYFRLLARRLEKYERNIPSQVDGIVTITNEDAVFFRELAPQIPLLVLPFAMQLPEIKAVSAAPFTVFHIGSMDWKPNAEGVAWLLREIWPAVKKAVPQASLHLAGRHMPEAFNRLGIDGVHVHGEVNDAHEFMSRYAVMAVPLLSGGGMRVKIVEGMALGKAIVSTAVGMEGVEAEDGRQFVKAADAKAFADAITGLLRSEEKTSALGASAREFAGKFFDRSAATAKLLDFYAEIIRKKNAH